MSVNIFKTCYMQYIICHSERSVAESKNLGTNPIYVTSTKRSDRHDHIRHCERSEAIQLIKVDHNYALRI